MVKKLTEIDYSRFMKLNQAWLDKLNDMTNRKSNFEWVNQLTYEQWVRWQNDELKMLESFKDES